MGKHPRQRKASQPLTREWVSQQDMIRIFGVTRDTFGRNIARYFPTDAIKKRGRQNFYHGRRCLNAWAEAVFGSNRQTPATAAGDSKERKQEYQARLLELQLHERSGAYVPRGDIVEMHNEMASVLREGGKEIERRYGRDAADLFSSLLDSVDRMLRNKLSATNGSGNGTTGVRPQGDR